jgi:hypothetical protein
MQTEQKFEVNTEIFFGIVIALVHFGWMTAEYYLGLHTKFMGAQVKITNFVAIPAIYLAYKAMIAKRDHSHTISLEHAVLSALVLGLITAILVPVSYWAFSKYINPNFFEHFARFATDVLKTPPMEAISTYSYKHYAKWGFIHALLIVSGTGIMTAIIMPKRSN